MALRLVCMFCCDWLRGLGGGGGGGGGKLCARLLDAQVCQCVCPVASKVHIIMPEVLYNIYIYINNA